ncbi:MAG TPA: 23S rRNA (uridine(2552)-2'-O)-methyltransferase RlmE [Gammaproteobacteria bacterium]|nr:23S rRNA (uridine(2552)-2'-O)-methyltransferase RlmE [Gammaproteobacteria bacterium]
MTRRRKGSSRRWLAEHHSDAYVKRARAEQWRSRAVFKLAELDDKYRLLKPGMTVVDLGAAPGGWSQYAAQRIGRGGRVFALDLLEMPPLAGVDLIRGDFRESGPLAALETALGGHQVDLVLSDMAPNISGVAAVDQPRAMALAELAAEFAIERLKPGGDFLVKVFQGEGFDAFVAGIRRQFGKVVIRKPDASRPRSREVYLLARDAAKQSV